MSPKEMVIYVAGTGLRGSGYPNASGTLRILNRLSGILVNDQSRWLKEGTTLWLKAKGRSALFLFKLGLVNAIEAMRIMPAAWRPGAWIYAPYPAVFLLWWLSWVPRGVRPRVIADAYISLWDSAFRDRRLSSEFGLLSRCVRRFESRALRAATMVFVDTVANRDEYIANFHIDPRSIRAIPLAIDAQPIADPPCLSGRLRVLFIGTLVPLHGIQVITDAASRLLDAGAPVDFTFVGDGQDRATLEALVVGPHGRRVNWCREWRSPIELSRLIRGADVCLGVFGGSGKAARVLPFKVYLALSAGKAVVTQREFSTPEGVPRPPVCGVDPTGESLARELEALAGNRARLSALAEEAASFYGKHLSADCISRAWLGQLRRTDGL